MGFKMRKKGKSEGVKEFVEKMKKMQEEAQAALKRVQKEMKRQADRKKGETEEYWKEDLVLLSTKVADERKVNREIDREICGTL